MSMKKYIMILLALIGCEKLEIQLPEPEPNNPTIITPITTNEYIYVLMAGQSNCEGGCYQIGSLTYSDSVELWYGQQWVKVSKETKGKIDITFANLLAKSEKKKVRILRVCRGGNPIENWLPPISNNMKAINKAVIASKIPKVDIILWSQGESNYNGAKVGICNNDICYIEKLNQLINIFKTNSYGGQNIYFISTSLINGVYGHRTPALLSLNDKQNDRLATVENIGFKACDNVHFNTPTQELIGQLMFNEFVKIRNN